MKLDKLKETIYDFISTDMSNDPGEISRLSINLQSANNETAVFYHLTDDKKSDETLIERLNEVGLLILNRRPRININCSYVVVDNFLECQKRLCDLFYPIPKKLRIIGVTGTNGKTTTCALAIQVCEQNKIKAFTIGSLGVRDNHRTIESLDGMTTPAYLNLRKIFHEIGVNYDLCIMEVSSHGLKQKRVYQIKYDAAGWTNFGQDHLDYHKDLDDYFKSKLLLIEEHLKEQAKLFIPQEESALVNKLKNYSVETPTRLSERNLHNLPPFFRAQFNQNDLELAIELVEQCFSDRIIRVKPDELTPPSGRFDYLEVNNKKVIIDSAHTPDAFSSFIPSVKQSFKEYKVWTLFGCGGDRDRSKRKEMAKIAQYYSDFVIVTSDNPRTEDPQKIISDILEGIDTKKEHKVISDRDKAISYAVKNMQQDVILLLLGKGAEDYQIIGTEKIKFSDKERFVFYAESSAPEVNA